MTPKRKRRSYKFTEKKHSKLAIGTLVTGAISGIILVLFLIEAFRTKGNASVYYGSMGILALNCVVGGLIGGVVAIWRMVTVLAEILKGIRNCFWTRCPKVHEMTDNKKGIVNRV